MVLVIRAIYTAILYLARFFPGMVAGFSKWFFAHKFYSTILMLVLFPVINFLIAIRMGGYVVQYVLDYMNTNYDLSTYESAVEVGGFMYYLLDNLGVIDALNLVLTACTIRFVMSFVPVGRIGFR